LAKRLLLRLNGVILEAEKIKCPVYLVVAAFIILRFISGPSFSSKRPFEEAAQTQQFALHFPQPKIERPLTTCLPSAAFLESECSERESNSHGFPHTPLKRARLPVPPSELEKNLSLLRG
jgi:hypothetical protein